MAEVRVMVDVDLEEIDSFDLVAELESRDFSVFYADTSAVDMDLMTALHDLIRSGQRDRALSILEPYLLDILGKAL